MHRKPSPVTVWGQTGREPTAKDEQPSRAVRSAGQLDQSAAYLLWLDSKRKEFRAKLRRIDHRIRRILNNTAQIAPATDDGLSLDWARGLLASRSSCDARIHMKALVRLFKRTFSEWSNDKAPRLGAALAYYSVFSIGPLVLLVVGVASLIFGADAAQGKVVDEIRGTMGDSAAKAIQRCSPKGNKAAPALARRSSALLCCCSARRASLGNCKMRSTRFGKSRQAGARAVGNHPRSLPLADDGLGTGFLLLISLLLTTAISAIGEAVSGAEGTFGKLPTKSPPSSSLRSCLR